MPLKDATQHRLDAIPDDHGALWAVVRFGTPTAQNAALLADRLDDKGHRSVPLAPKGEAVEAYVNEGRWVVDCPTCAGAQLACLSDPRFMCNECGNAEVGGRFRPVVLPVARTREALARILEPRPTANQHWRPGETLADLRRENRAHAAELEG